MYTFNGNFTAPEQKKTDNLPNREGEGGGNEKKPFYFKFTLNLI